MRTHRQNPSLARSQRGTTIIEFMVFLAVIVPVMAALAGTVTIFSETSTASHHRVNVLSQNQKILRRIAAELTLATTKRDHTLFGNPPLPHPDAFTPGEINSAYNTFRTMIAPPVDEEFPTLARDGSEYWHDEWERRRLYVYATYQAFDTIEFQKVRTPIDQLSHIAVAAGTVSQPWSAKRKIMLEDGKVLLKVERVGEAPRTVVIGTNVASLAFHLNPEGHIIIRLTTISGREAGQQGSPRGAQATSQVTVNPRNGLS